MRHRSGLVPLRLVVIAALAFVALVAWWTYNSTSSETADGRKTIVFWGSTQLGDDIYTVINHFERKHPEYKVVIGTAVARDLTGDAQRLLSAVVGGVPPDVVWFDRFAIGEWAGRGSLEDLTPYLANQKPDDPYRIDLADYYPFTVAEASYSKPGTSDPVRLYGVPTTIDIRALFSNGDLLRQEGLVDEHGEPKPPKTWEELRDYAKRLVRFRIPGDKTSGITRLGLPAASGAGQGNSWLYMYAWQAGGELLSPDRTKVTMDSPPVVRALNYMMGLNDDQGGVAQVSGFADGFQSGALDPFLKNMMAMKTDGDWSLSIIADWNPQMDFILSPAPMPADELAKGRKPITWAGGWTLVIPTTAKQKEGAFKLIQYLRSWEAVSLLEQSKREQKHSEGRLYLPVGNANQKFYERLVKEAVDDNPDVPKRFKQAYKVLGELMPNTLIRPVTPVGQLLWNQHVSAYDKAVNHTFADAVKPGGPDEATLALRQMQEPVQRQLDYVLKPPPPTVVSWTPYFVLYGLLVLAPFVAMAVFYRRHRKRFGYKPREVLAALFFASPWFLGFIVLVGGPILFSIVFSFTSYDVLSPARYVGVGNYAELLGDAVFYKSLGNTVFMIIRIPLNMAISLGIALLLNRAIRGIGLYRTAFYLPSIMPLVAASLLWLWVFHPTFGLLNQFLRIFFDNPPVWLKDQNWSKPALIIMNLWGAGGGMIIWLAGLQGIPQYLYEAAEIDGANAWQRFWNITLPMLTPFVFFNLIMGLIGTMQVFGEAYIMTEGGPADSTLFYAYYLFKQAFQYFRLGYASALAWILFLVVFGLTMVQMWLGKKWVNYDQA